MEIIIKKFNELTLNELYELLKIRASVFVVEQKCPFQEIDDKDNKAYHIYIKDKDKIKAYLRVLDRGVYFDEVALSRVLTTERNKGYSNIIIKEGIKVAKEKFDADKIKVEAQSYTKELYEKFGFKQMSEEYLLDNIPHIEMLLTL